MSIYRSVHRDLRPALRLLEKNGWTITVGGSGRLKLIAPGGKAMLGLPKTPRHGNVIWDLYNKLKIKGYTREGIEVPTIDDSEAAKVSHDAAGITGA